MTMTTRILFALLPVAAAACVSVRPVLAPAQFVPTSQPQLVWVTVENGEQLALSRPTITGDSLSGQHFGDRVDLLGGKGDDGRSRRQPRKLGRAGIAQGREARPPDDLGLGKQSAHHWRQAVRAQDHGLLAAARV